MLGRARREIHQQLMRENEWEKENMQMGPAGEEFEGDYKW